MGHAKTRRRKERSLREGIFAALRLGVTLQRGFFHMLRGCAASGEATENRWHRSRHPHSSRLWDAHGFANCTSVVTIASRSSVTEMNQVFASAGGRGAVMMPSPMVAGSSFQVRFERRPSSVV